MNSILVGTSLLAVIVGGTIPPTAAQEQSVSEQTTRVTRIGAVASVPRTVTVFQGLRRYLNKNGFACDYVLYSNYDALVAALERGEIEIAWNTPMAHGQFHVRNQCASQTLVMRDVDVNRHLVLVARADADIESLVDLAGKRLVMSGPAASETTVLARHFLKKQGLVDQIQLVDFAQIAGNTPDRPKDVLEALEQNHADAAMISANQWHRFRDQADRQHAFRLVWTSPPFSHCVFTASATFDKELGSRFTQLMTAMDPQHPETRDIMQLEGTSKWLPGSDEGFESLVKALLDDQ